jgi:hypothetical protein
MLFFIIAAEGFLFPFLAFFLLGAALRFVALFFVDLLAVFLVFFAFLAFFFFAMVFLQVVYQSSNLLLETFDWMTLSAIRKPAPLSTFSNSHSHD